MTLLRKTSFYALFAMESSRVHSWRRRSWRSAGYASALLVISFFLLLFAGTSKPLQALALPGDEPQLVLAQAGGIQEAAMESVTVTSVPLSVQNPDGPNAKAETPMPPPPDPRIPQGPPTAEQAPAAEAPAPQPPEDSPASLPAAAENLPDPIAPAEVNDPGNSSGMPFQNFGDSSATLHTTSANGLVTSVFVDTSIREALADIASQTGEVIVPDASIQGNITCDLKDVPLEQALKIVLSVGNFAWKRMDGYIVVGSTDIENPSFATFSQTKVVKLDHLAAKTAVAMLSTPMQKYVKASDPVDPKSNGPVINAVSITGSPSLIEQVEASLKQMDETPRQVMLDARIVVLENGDVTDLGTQWAWPTLAAGIFTDSEHHGNGTSAAGANWPWGLQIGYTPSKDFTNSLLLKLNLLTQNNDATVMANPKVVAVDGREAQLGVTTEEYFEILTKGYYDSSELEKIQAGTTLRITPHIENDTKISMEMAVEVSDVVARGSNNLPVVTRRIAQSTVAVDNGGTAVVAGLLDNRTRYNQERIPIIGRIPFIGRLFRNDSHSNSARQVAIFVTARLVPLDNVEQAQPTKEVIIPPVDPETFREELKNCLAQGQPFPEKTTPASAIKPGIESAPALEIKPTTDAVQPAKESNI